MPGVFSEPLQPLRSSLCVCHWGAILGPEWYPPLVQFLMSLVSFMGEIHTHTAQDWTPESVNSFKDPLARVPPFFVVSLELPSTLCPPLPPPPSSGQKEGAPSRCAAPCLWLRPHEGPGGGRSEKGWGVPTLSWETAPADREEGCSWAPLLPLSLLWLWAPWGVGAGRIKEAREWTGSPHCLCVLIAPEARTRGSSF